MEHHVIPHQAVSASRTNRSSAQLFDINKIATLGAVVAREPQNHSAPFTPARPSPFPASRLRGGVAALALSAARLQPASPCPASGLRG